MKKFIITALCGFALVSMNGGVAAAAKPAPGGTKPTVSTIGNDISYPQCRGKLPSGQAFGIVGVNGGLANTNNPCFSTQLAWAEQSNGLTAQPKASLYVNTANPGHDATVWPANNTVGNTAVDSPYGTCNGAEDAACAYIYGWTRAYEDATIRNVPNPASYKWWLDVETTNSWSATDLQANAASLEGMVAYFNTIGAKVGLYSTGYQWDQIIGTLPDTSPLNGLDSWLAGALSQSGAEMNCKAAPLTLNGQVTLAQFVTRGVDYDVSCI